MFSFSKNKLLVVATLFVVGLSSGCSLLTNAPGGDNNNNSKDTVSPNPLVSISSSLSSNGGSVAVSIELPADAPTGTLVYYTTDGSDPSTSSTALVYMLPFVVTGNTETVTIKAVAVSPGLTESSIIIKQPWFGEWEFVGNDYLQNIDGGSFDHQISSLYIDASGIYMVTNKGYKWDGSSWTVAVNAGGCDGSDQLQIKNFFVESGAIYCSFYGSGPGYVSRTVSGITTQLGDTLGDGHVSIVPCYGTVCAGLSDSFNGNKATVKMYNAASNSWLPMGTGIISNGAASGAVPLFSFKESVYAMFADQDSYVAGVGANLIIKRYNNGAWIDITDTTVKVADINRRFSLFVYDDGTDEGAVYVVLSKFGVSGPFVRLYKNGVWSDVGGSISSAGFDHVNIDVIDGTPYVTYTDYTPAPTSGHARTRFFNGVNWEDLGSITYGSDSFYTKTAIFNGQLYRYVKGWWIESFGPNGSGIVSGGVQYPLDTP